MEKLIEHLTASFESRFGGAPRIFRAPGRVNLIGEHTDYNDGFVMPFAIDRSSFVAANARDDSKINAYALDLDESATIDLDAEPIKQRGDWVDYVEGTARCITERIGRVGGADIVFSSNVPIGAGLSSSAAIEMSIGIALIELYDLDRDRKELAFAAQQVEHEFVGVRSGIMDQFASAFGKKGNAMLLDCRSLEIDYIPVDMGPTAVAVIDTKVKHSLKAGSEYNTRRQECEEGVAILQKRRPGIKSLRDVTLDDLEQYGSDLSDVVRRRCLHVVTENARTTDAAKAFAQGDSAEAGRLMIESHRSLRDDYEVSCAELDFLVDTALAVTGVYGARMTGGGFGGCTVNVIDRESVEELKAETTRKYAEKFGFEPDFYLFQAADGASEVTV